MKKHTLPVEMILGVLMLTLPLHVIGAVTVPSEVGDVEVDFVAKPTARREGERVRIHFAVSRQADVEVAISDAGGKIVRHLGAGVLGPNAPEPFQAGTFEQALEWDGRDDEGNPAENRPFKAVVGLGLCHRFDRIIGWNPKAIRKIYSIAVASDGRVYVLWAQPETVAGPPQVAVLDRQGNYERTILPYPANMPPERMVGIKPIRLADGNVVPRIHHGLAMTFYPWLSGTCRQTMVLTPRGKLVMATGYFNYSTAGSMGPRRLLMVNPDGSCPDSFEGPVLDKRLWGGRPVEGYIHLAASPDGRFVYASGLYENNDWAKEHIPSCVVLRVRLGGGGSEVAEVFFGERGQAGKDDKHLNDPRGLAVDNDGNLLIADYGNQRLVKIDQAGRFLGEIKAEWPDQIAVNRKTGAIYVVSVNHGEHGPFNLRGWQKKRLLKLRSWTEPVTVASLEGLEGLDALTVAVDDRAEPPVVWFTLSHPNTYHGSGRGLFRCVDEGSSFSKPVAVLGPEAGGTGLAVCGYVVADPLREQIHVRGDAENSARAWMVFDGRTGSFLGFSNLRPVGEERTFDSGGFLYSIFAVGSASNAVGRWGAEPNTSRIPDFKPAPFEGASTHVVCLPGGLKARPRGFCVARNGDIYVLHYAGNPWKPEGMHTAVTVIGRNGVVKGTEVIVGMRTAAGVRVDRNGNIYLAENIKTAREPFPFELGIEPVAGGRIWGAHYDHSAWYPWLYGSILKFRPDGGKIERGEAAEYFTGWPAWYQDKGGVRVTGAVWSRVSIAPIPAADQACVCDAGRFDLDAFGRIYVPDVGRFRITVLDSAGNEICHFGSYGNMDSTGPKSLVPEPEIPFGWPACVAVSREAVYVGDWLNNRVVRVRAVSRRVETVPIP